MPTISVIVPVYKVEPYLRQCVDSILGQAFRDFELILVDDGSPDGCPAIRVNPQSFIMLRQLLKGKNKEE